MAYNALSGTIKQLHSASLALTGTFSGDGSELAFPTSQIPEYVVTPDDNRLITFTNTTGKTLRGEADLTFDGANLSILNGGITKVLLDNTGLISASNNISAAFFYGDGRYLTGITASGGGGSASAQGPVGALQFQTGSGGISGSALALYDFTNKAMQIKAGLVHARTPITTNHTAAANEYYLGVRAASLEILFDATKCVGGQTYVVKDEVGSADPTTPITLKASASQLIDNTSSLTIQSPYGAIHMYTDGSNWYVY